MVDESVNHPTQAPRSPRAAVKASDPAGTRCVILTGPDGSTPADLLSGLSKRGVSSRVVSEPANVMVELGRQRTAILIVVHTAQQPALVDLIEAVTKYHPDTIRWAYEPDHPSGKPQLVPFRYRSRPEIAKPKASPPPVEAVPPKPAPVVSLDAPSPLGRVQSQVPPERVRSLIVKVQGPAEVGEPLISEEELAMLLGPVPEEAGGHSEQGGE